MFSPFFNNEKAPYLVFITLHVMCLMCRLPLPDLIIKLQLIDKIADVCVFGLPF
jgi:hypothetical protein